jgi:hypothetical protein
VSLSSKVFFLVQKVYEIGATIKMKRTLETIRMLNKVTALYPNLSCINGDDDDFGAILIFSDILFK